MQACTAAAKAATSSLVVSQAVIQRTWLRAVSHGQKKHHSRSGSMASGGSVGKTLLTVGGVSYPCGARDCSIFVYRDHRGLFDASLDTVVPLMFLIDPTVRLRPTGLAADGATVKVGSSVAIRNTALRTTDDVRVNVRTLSPKVCSVSKGATTTTVRYLRAGECALALRAKGDSVVTKNLDLRLTHTVN